MERIGLRRLTVVLAADIAGYSRLMQADEKGTHARVHQLLRGLIGPIVAEHRGRIVKTMGDGFLAAFESPVEAVRCAIVLQQNMIGRNLELPKTQWIQYRIGVNLGDVILDEDDIYGEGVNIAARLEQMAEPGWIYISGSIYEQIKNKLVCGYQSLGDRKVKNITDPIAIYRVLPDPATVRRATRWRAPVLAMAALMFAGSASAALYLWSRNNNNGAPVKVRLIPPPPDSISPRATTPPPVSPPPAETAPSVGQPAATRPEASGQAAQNNPPESQASAPRPENSRTTNPEGVATAAIRPTLVPPETAPAPGAPRFKEPAMVQVPGGRFRMGSKEDPTEQPIHLVSVKSFWIGKYPVTAGEWRACAAARACQQQAIGDDDQPMTNVSWFDAMQYVAWLSHETGKDYRLPTEAEWEYAARGGSATRYWWGDTIEKDRADCSGCGSPHQPERPLKVGSFAANNFGLFDMGGGVSEWVADCWHPSYLGAPADGSAWSSANCGEHVLRGGSWLSEPDVLRVSDREHYETRIRYPGNGFRLARSD